MAEIASNPWNRFADVARKKRFAALYRARPQNTQGRMEAAMLTFPDEVDNALVFKAADEYPYDRVCVDERDRLDLEEKGVGLPTKELQAREIWNMANDMTKSVTERLAAHKLYAEIQGNIVKGAPGGGAAPTIYNDNRRVMYYPSIPQGAAAVDAWENQAIDQQARLVADAATN